MWNKDLVRQVVSTKKFVVVVSSLASFAVGAVGGYFFSKKKLQDFYLELSHQEIKEAKLFYQQQNKTGEFANPSVLAEKYSDSADLEETVDLLNSLKYTVDTSSRDETPNIEVQESIARNIFDTENGYDPDEETFKKDNGLPYIVTEETFFENENDYSQTSLTYFEGDDVLTDERQQPIRDFEKVIGSDNLRFGVGARDKHMVYIFNDELNAGYEIARSRGKFAEEVLGFIEHSEKPRPRKFRVDD